MNDTKGYIQSPNYPNEYPYSMSCSWTIRGPTNSFIILSFINFETEPGHDFLEIYDGSADSLVANHSGSDKLNDLLSSSNTLILKFVSDMNIQMKGFKISYKIIIRGI